MTSDDLLDIFFQMLKDVIEGITLPTGKNLMPSFFYALGITLLSIITTIAGQFAVVDWRGGVVATCALGVLVFIERRGLDEVSRLYRVAKSRAGTIAQRAARPGTNDEDTGDTDAGVTDDVET